MSFCKFNKFEVKSSKDYPEDSPYSLIIFNKVTHTDYSTQGFGTMGDASHVYNPATDYNYNDFKIYVFLTENVWGDAIRSILDDNEKYDKKDFIALKNGLPAKIKKVYEVH